MRKWIHYQTSHICSNVLVPKVLAAHGKSYQDLFMIDFQSLPQDQAFFAPRVWVRCLPALGGEKDAVAWKMYGRHEPLFLTERVPTTERVLLLEDRTTKHKSGWWQLKNFPIFTPNITEDSRFDKHIFRRGGSTTN